MSHFQRPVQKIPKRVIPAPEDYLQQRIQLRYCFPNFRAPNPYEKANGSQATEAVLLKYYPKYCRSLRFDDRKKQWSVLARIKQIKIIEKFLYNFGEIDSFEKKEIIIKKIKSLFRNKRKSIWSLPETNSGDKGPFQKMSVRVLMDLCPYFPRIHTLKVFQPRWLLHNHLENSPSSRNFERKVTKSYGYFWHTLKYVQHLELSTDSPDVWVILPQLRSSKNFLSFLKTFCLEVEPIYLQEWALGVYSSPRLLFQILMLNKDLLKYVTHLKFIGFSKFHYYTDQVKLILDSCPNITFLSFPIEYLEQKNQLIRAPLQSLQNVTILTLKVNSIWDFIETFEIPIFLEKLTLHLYGKYSWLDMWKSLYPLMDDDPEDETLFQSYEKYKVLLNFIEKFKRTTTNLTSFDLNMHLFTNANEVMNNFIIPLIKAIPKLENFECQLYQMSLEAENYFDFSIFLDGITPLQQLKSFKIFQRLRGPKSSIQSGDLVMTFAPLKSYFFPHITSVYIDTWIHEDFNFKKFFKIFSSNLKEITLAEIHASSIDSFIRLLRFFSNLDQLPSAKINLTITLRVDNFEDLRNLGHYLFIPAENVFITTNIYISSPNLRYLSPTGIQRIQDALGYLKVNLTVLVLQEERWSGNYNKHIPIMRNNIPYDSTMEHNEPNYENETLGRF